MATVRSALTLDDKVSPVLASITSSLKATLSMMSRVDQAARAGISANSWNSAQTSIRGANRALEELSRTQGNLPSGQEQVRFGFEGWKATIITCTAAIKLVESAMAGITKLTGIADAFVDSSVRLDLINDGLRTTDQLQGDIYKSAQLTRSSYQGTLAAVTQMGIAGKTVFKGNTQAVIAFTELLNKSLFLSGTKGAGRDSAILQISQALAMGTLRGEEFNSVMQNAPFIMQKLSAYTGKTVGELKQMGTDGKLASETLVKALMAAGPEIDALFNDAPDNFSDMMTKLGNSALMAFKPIIGLFIEGINSPAFQSFIDARITDIMAFVAWIEKLINRVREIASSQGFQSFITDVTSLAGMAIEVISWLIDGALAFGDAWFSCWSVIGPILLAYVSAMAVITAAQTAYNVVMAIRKGIEIACALTSFAMAAATGTQASATALATAAQYGLNAALWACPITWVVIAVAALIGVLVAVAAHMGWLGDANDSLGTRILTVWYNILGFFDQVGIVFWAVAFGIIGAFDSANVTVQTIMQNMANGVINIINGLINMLNKLPGVSVEAFDQMEFAAKTAANAELKKQGMEEQLSGMKESAAAKQMERQNTIAARAKPNAAAGQGALGGENAAFNYAALSNGINGLNKGVNVKGGKLDKVGSTKLDSESMQFMKDVAKQEYVNKYTTQRPTVNVKFGDVRETADVNAIMEVLERQVAGAYSSSLEGGGA